MPIYEYRCSACGHQHDALQRLADAPLVDCPECAAPALKRQVSAPSFRLKGGGWYETDFKNDKRRNIAESESKPADQSDGKAADKAAGKQDGKPGGQQEGKDRKAADKPDRKADSKSDSKSDSKPAPSAAKKPDAAKAAAPSSANKAGRDA
ncbi:MAG: FmdB family zinc ribbon protein [Gammaproteobacteria bacterium]